ncbi:MAG: hypothetical protein ACFFG0_07110 [Candidatus Thorarchaeota archaeon]
MSQKKGLYIRPGPLSQRGVIAIENTRVANWINFQEQGKSITIVYYETKEFYNRFNAAAVEALYKELGTKHTGIIRTYILESTHSK